MLSAIFLVAVFATVKAQSFGKIANTNVQVRTTNPYYLSKKGRATLISGRRIEGLFYYSSPPFWGDNFFFFYPSDIKSRQKIYVNAVSTVSFPSISREDFTYSLKGKCLVRTTSIGSVEELNTRVLGNIEQSKN